MQKIFSAAFWHKSDAVTLLSAIASVKKPVFFTNLFTSFSVIRFGAYSVKLKILSGSQADIASILTFLISLNIYFTKSYKSAIVFAILTSAGLTFLP